MADWHYLDFDDPEAQRLADLVGVRTDLETCERACEEFLRTDLDSFARQALCVTALISLGRAQGSGVRQGLTEAQLGQLTDVQTTNYWHFKDVRDKYIAHSVNAFEENHVRLYYDATKGEPKAFERIGYGYYRVVALSDSAISALMDVAIALKTIVIADLNAEEKRVLEYALAHSSGDLATSEPTAFRGGASAPSKSRRKLGAKNRTPRA